MKQAIIFSIIAILSGIVYANCTQQTVIQPNGKVTICSTCCDSSGNCTVVCTPN